MTPTIRHTDKTSTITEQSTAAEHYAIQTKHKREPGTRATRSKGSHPCIVIIWQGQAFGLLRPTLRAVDLRVDLSKIDTAIRGGTVAASALILRGEGPVMVLKVTRGYSPDYLLKEVATGRENYYTGAVAAGEPPGRWWGSGAELLGLRGLVDAQDMRAVYERFLDPREEGFNDPSKWDEVYTLGHAGRRYLSEDELYAAAVEREPDADAERRQELRVEAGKNARHNVAFFDLTYNVQKSITLLHTAFEAQAVAARRAGDTERAEAWDRFRETVEEAIWAGNNAMLAYLQQEAGYSRIDHHGGGAGRWIDARGWVVGSFFQHDSREHDPHLHIHNAALNRVLGEDGVWRTIDGQLLYRWKRAAAAVAERVTAEHLTHALGVLVAMRPDGKAREVVGISHGGDGAAVHPAPSGHRRRPPSWSRRSKPATGGARPVWNSTGWPSRPRC